MIKCNPKHLRGCEVLVIYTSQQFDEDDPIYIPCRMGKIFSVDVSGGFWSTTIELLDYVCCEDSSKFTSLIKRFGKDVPLTKNLGKYWTITPKSIFEKNEGSINFGPNIENWRSTVEKLSNQQDFCSSQYNFFTISNIALVDNSNIRGESGNSFQRATKCLYKNGEYSFEGGKKYVAQVHFDFCKSLDTGNVLEISSASDIQFISSTECEIVNEYELKNFYFIADRPSRTKYGVISFSTMKISKEACSEHKTRGIHFDLPYNVNVCLLKSILTILLMAIGLYFTSSAQDFWFLKFIAATLAAAAAFYGIPKIK